MIKALVDFFGTAVEMNVLDMCVIMVGCYMFAEVRTFLNPHRWDAWRKHWDANRREEHRKEYMEQMGKARRKDRA